MLAEKMQNGNGLPSPTPSHASSCSSASSCVSGGPPPMLTLGSDGQVLEDLDWFYIKQLAHHCKEKELETKLDVELKVRDGIRRLLKACRGKTQLLEAAKSLKTSNERVSALMAELQSRRKRTLARAASHEAASTYEKSADVDVSAHASPSVIRRSCLHQDVCPAGSKDAEFPSEERTIPKARVSLSDIRIPLIWNDVDHHKHRGHHQRRFALFCLAKIGADIQDTELINPVDQSCTDVSFNDVLIFNNVPPDFTCSLEVYCHALQEDCLTISSAPRKLKKSFHSSISKTIGKKLALSLKDELSEGSIGPKFFMVASGTMNLDDANVEVQTIDLKLERDPCAAPASGHGNGGFGTLQRKGSTVSTLASSAPTSVFYTMSLNNNNHNHHHHNDPVLNGPAFDLPLFGHFCCRLAVAPEEASQKSSLPGSVKVWVDENPIANRRDEDESYDDEEESRVLEESVYPEDEAESCTGEVSDFALHLLPVSQSDGGKIGSELRIPLTSSTELSCCDLGPVRKCIKVFYCSKANGLQRVILEPAIGEELTLWLEKLEASRSCALLWRRVAECPMELAASDSNKFHFNKYSRLRAGSLYDETSLQDTPPKTSSEDAGSVDPDDEARSEADPAVGDLTRKLAAARPDEDDVEDVGEKAESSSVAAGSSSSAASSSSSTPCRRREAGSPPLSVDGRNVVVVVTAADGPAPCTSSPLLTWDSKEWKLISKSCTNTAARSATASSASAASSCSSLSSDTFSTRFNTR